MSLLQAKVCGGSNERRVSSKMEMMERATKLHEMKRATNEILKKVKGDSIRGGKKEKREKTKKEVQDWSVK